MKGLLVYVLLIAGLLGLVVTYDYGKCNNIYGIFQLLYVVYFNYYMWYISTITVYVYHWGDTRYFPVHGRKLGRESIT